MLRLLTRLSCNDLGPVSQERLENADDIWIVLHMKNSRQLAWSRARPAPDRGEEPGRIDRLVEPIDDAEGVARQFGLAGGGFQRDDDDRQRPGLLILTQLVDQRDPVLPGQND